MEQASLDYAVVGGNAVAAWVATVDAGAVRNTRDVDLLLRRSDVPLAILAMQKAGFLHRRLGNVDVFLDAAQATGDELKGRRVDEAVHLVFAREYVREEYALPAPGFDEVERLDEFAVIGLEALVRMKLTSYRRKDQVHILDLVGVGLVDSGWLERFPSPLDARLKELLDNPD